MDKKVAATALLLIFGAGTAAAWLFAVIGALGLVGFGYFLGMQNIDEANQKIAELEAILTQSNTTNYYNMRQKLNDTLEQHYMFITFSEDVTQYLINYAWSLAKYEYMNATNNGLNHSEAITQAQAKVEEYYDKLIKNIITEHNETAQIIAYTLDQTITAANNAGFSKPADYYSNEAPITQWTGLKLYSAGSELYSVKVPPGTTTYVLSITALDNKNYNYLGLKTNVYSMSGGDWTSPAVRTVDRIDFSDTVVWSTSKLTSLISQIDNQYNIIISNLATYLNEVQASNLTVNESDLIDPYVLATLLNTDWNTTGYYGFAAAELALMGLPLTGLNKTINVTIGNETYEGFLFSNLNTTIEKGQTYDPAGYIVYLLTDNGLVKVTEPFMVTNITDNEGNELQNTTFVKYVYHSGDIQKFVEEMQKLRELYEEYLAMQTVSGGSGSVGDWWANLSDTEKLAIGAAAVLLIVLIARK
jgi:hypothetical protein